MRIGRVLLALFCAILLAAHFFRAGRLPLALVSVAVGMLPFARAGWATRAAQAGLLLGAMEWARTGAALVEARRGMNLPFVRLAAILGAVTLLTAVSALLLDPLRGASPPEGKGSGRF